jgi:NhaP-type Na+/H+ or K+/H+ antiporter
VHHLAASPGFELSDAYPFGLAFAGLAVFVAIAALSHQHERAFSASVIYLGLGVAAAVAIARMGTDWVDPLSDHTLLEHLTELAVIIALFGTGLRLDRPLRARLWASTARLLAIAMPLTIGLIALFGWRAMGLSAGAALILGASLAPTDPVLAGDVGVGGPGSDDETEPEFSLSAEAGLNDGLALPFLLLGAVVAGHGSYSGWALSELAYGIPLGVAAGGGGGWLLAALAVRLRDRDFLSHDFDGWLAVGAVLLLYGLVQGIDGYGFLAAFAGGVGFRRYERDHDVNQRVHGGVAVIEKFSELAIILLLGSILTLSGLSEPGVTGWLLVPLLFLAIRPVAVGLSLIGSRLTHPERVFVGWFGVRGVGTLNYVVVALGLGVLSAEEARVVFWTVAACVVSSIVIHGISATPLSRRLLD